MRRGWSGNDSRKNEPLYHLSTTFIIFSIWEHVWATNGPDLCHYLLTRASAVQYKEYIGFASHVVSLVITTWLIFLFCQPFGLGEIIWTM